MEDIQSLRMQSSNNFSNALPAIKLLSQIGGSGPLRTELVGVMVNDHMNAIGGVSERDKAMVPRLMNEYKELSFPERNIAK